LAKAAQRSFLGQAKEVFKGIKKRHARRAKPKKQVVVQFVKIRCAADFELWCVLDIPTPAGL
jgi:hypothetical protein